VAIIGILIILLILMAMTKHFTPGIYGIGAEAARGISRGVFSLVWGKPAGRRGSLFGLWFLWTIFVVLHTLGMIIAVANGTLEPVGLLLSAAFWASVIFGYRGVRRWEAHRQPLRPLPGRRHRRRRPRRPLPRQHQQRYQRPRRP
jgi:hypothetical protein